MTKINATLGFLFTRDFQKVLLIKKQKPASHKNKLNGLGGKTGSGETNLECIVREVEEESGLNTLQKDWHEVGGMYWQEWDVVLFAAIYQGQEKDLKNLSEEVGWYSVEKLPKNLISNVYWLIPLCVDVLKNEKTLHVTIQYDRV